MPVETVPGPRWEHGRFMPIIINYLRVHICPISRPTSASHDLERRLLAAGEASVCVRGILKSYSHDPLYANFVGPSKGPVRFMPPLPRSRPGLLGKFQRRSPSYMPGPLFEDRDRATQLYNSFSSSSPPPPPMNEAFSTGTPEVYGRQWSLPGW